MADHLSVKKSCEILFFNCGWCCDVKMISFVELSGFSLHVGGSISRYGGIRFAFYRQDL